MTAGLKQLPLSTHCPSSCPPTVHPLPTSLSSECDPIEERGRGQGKSASVKNEPPHAGGVGSHHTVLILSSLPLEDGTVKSSVFAAKGDIS